MLSDGFPQNNHKGSSLGIQDLLYDQFVATELGKELIRGFSPWPAFALGRLAVMLCSKYLFPDT